GERDETRADVIDWSRPHRVIEKLDGSMIHPAILADGSVRFMTRAGITDVSRACEARHLSGRLPSLCAELIEHGALPVFEWVSPVNRIVLGYPDDRLVLLALRTMATGRYERQQYADEVAARYGLERPRALATDAYGDWAGLAKHCADLEDAEGY